MAESPPPLPIWREILLVPGSPVGLSLVTVLPEEGWRIYTALTEFTDNKSVLYLVYYVNSAQ